LGIRCPNPQALFIDALQSAEADLEVLSRQYQQNKGKDYFNSAPGKSIKDALLAAREMEP